MQSVVGAGSGQRDLNALLGRHALKRNKPREAGDFLIIPDLACAAGNLSEPCSAMS